MMRIRDSPEERLDYVPHELRNRSLDSIFRISCTTPASSSHPRALAAPMTAELAIRVEIIDSRPYIVCNQPLWALSSH